jgi:hypothetical protein
MPKHNRRYTIVAGGCSSFKRENMPQNFKGACEVGLGDGGSRATEDSVNGTSDEL